MNYQERRGRLRKFLEQMDGVLDQKGPDYVPDKSDAFGEVKRIAEDLSILPRQVLWVYARKHISAIASSMRVGHVPGEPLRSRLIDLANYCALIAVMDEENEEFDPDVEDLDRRNRECAL